MKKTRFQKVLCFVLSVTMLLSVCGMSVFAASDEDSYKRNPSTEEKNPYSASTLEEMQALVGTLTYAQYLSSFSDQRNQYKTEVLDKAEKDPQTGEIILPSIFVPDITKSAKDSDVSDAEKGKVPQTVSKNQLCIDSMATNPDEWVSFGEENKDTTLYLPAQGKAAWNVTITAEQQGFYYIKIEYYSVKTSESSISSIERKLKIDDKVPFNEVSSLKLNKNWFYNYNANVILNNVDTTEADDYIVEYELRDTAGQQGYYKIVTEIKNGKKTVTEYKIMQDINGNSMAPEADPKAGWNTYYVQDSSGYYDGYFEFYFGEGVRTISLEAEREPMIIKSIELIPVTEPIAVSEDEKGNISIQQNDLPSYAEILAQYANAGYAVAENGKIIELQAEFPDFVSDSSVTATNDNTSAINSPVSANAQLYNVIGENSYSAVGQWAAYKFTVTESGLYNLAMRFKQDALQGMYICRTIKLHGGIYGEADGTPEVPFAEAYQAEFNYDKKWQSTFVSKNNRETGENIPFMFYFEEGVEYTVYFECSLGTLKEYIQQVELSLDNINACYLRILQYIGTDPDEYITYNFLTAMPEVLITLLEEAIRLENVKLGLQELCGTNGSHIATLHTIALLLNTMGEECQDLQSEQRSRDHDEHDRRIDQHEA